MFVLICNSGDDNQLWSTLKGVFETHSEAHDAMVECIEAHKADLVEEYDVGEECFMAKFFENEGCLIDGDEYDWYFYEKYLIFDSDNPMTFRY